MKLHLVGGDVIQRPVGVSVRGLRCTDITFSITELYILVNTVDQDTHAKYFVDLFAALTPEASLKMKKDLEQIRATLKRKM